MLLYTIQSAAKAGKGLCRMNAFKLHVLAMSFMLCDHLYRTVFPEHFYLTCIGRLAFPLFAFLIVEGFYHTRDRRRYGLRLAGLALISEIPYNLLCSGHVFDPAGQNVIWTFLLALFCMWCIERRKTCSGSGSVLALDSFIIVFWGYLLGFLLFTDYKGFGVLTVLVFYFFRGSLWQHRLCQFSGLFLINLLSGILSGIYMPAPWLPLPIPYQLFAVCSFIFLWSYTGEKGYASPLSRVFCYSFYPLHLLILLGISS